MITIFHFITFLCAIICAASGGIIGNKLYGMFGGVAGAAICGYIGLIIGRLPGFFSERALANTIRHKSTDELRAILQGNQFQLFHLVIAALAVRGEDIQTNRDCVLKLLVADSYAARVSGWRTLRHFFPEVADRIAEYQPKDSVEVCRAKTQGLEGMT